MQIDMHFYGIYALCRLAGISSQNAHVIAYSSQFVDDAIEGENVIFRKSEKALRAVMTSHKPIDYQNAIFEDQWNVWTSFHFLPGNESESGKFEEKMICRQNSELAKLVLKNAEDNILENFGLHLVGIASHSYADTFAHLGFLGISSDWNKVKGNTIVTNIRRRKLTDFMNDMFTSIKGEGAKLIPVGHGSVGTYPDQPYLEWEYKYERGRRAKVTRFNWENFYLASQLLYQFYVKLLSKIPSIGSSSNTIPFEDFKDEIKKILRRQANTENRIKIWKEFIKSGIYFDTDDTDQGIHYNEKLWKINPNKQKKYTDDQVLDLPLYQFMKAAKMQIKLVSNFLIKKGITF